MKPIISKVRELIERERLYLLMLSFIIVLNSWLIFSQKLPALKESPLNEKILGPAASQVPGQAQAELGLGYDRELYKEIQWQRLLKEKAPFLFLLNVLVILGILVFLLGLFLDFRVLKARAKNQQFLKMLSAHASVKWGIRDILRVTVVFVFLGYLIHFAERTFLSWQTQATGLIEIMPLLNTGIMDLLLLGFIVYFVKVKYKQNLEALGLKLGSVTKCVFLGILSYIAFLPILFLLIVALVAVSDFFHYRPSAEPLFSIFFKEQRPWFLFYSISMVVLLGPIVEEAFFRGFSYNAIKRKWGASVAMAVTAVIFAALHTNLIGFLPIMALGLLLAYVYEKTGSLICSITVHILHNFLLVGFLFLGRYLMDFLK